MYSNLGLQDVRSLGDQIIDFMNVKCYYIGIIFIISIFLSCTSGVRNISVEDKNILGSWVASESPVEPKTFYPKLTFIDDSTMIIPTRGDTIIHCNFILKNDSLFLYLKHHNLQLIGKSKVLELTSQSLKLSNILSENGEIIYCRK